MRNTWLSPVKKMVLRLAPGLYEGLRLAKNRSVLRAVVRRNGLRVNSGPFVGMKYIGESAGSSLIPKLLGTYEAELHPILAKIKNAGYEAVIDIGCAEGYYAVGLALMLPNTQVMAFDTDPHAQELCRSLAIENGVQNRVDVRGTCCGADLLAMAGKRILLICDCEGYETELFNRSVAESLRRWDMLIELHDVFVPNCTGKIREAFAESHEQMLIQAVPRNPRGFPESQVVPPWHRKFAIDETRPSDQRWIWLSAKGSRI